MKKLRKEKKKGKKWLKLKPLLPVVASWVDPDSREWMRKPSILS